ncbi:uncharacterized protein LOC128883623 isoform X2 [Hylaeus volcanicus]|uniref:uncharacterized protein LOC128883623 isoform X2 n=1 Tax=Hylaeus volcanicus TaxID=313075 RepID=UPI0023B7E768|nr:uncharacterized protein LOC128883623 isoform X2 [Hylaeus volcanicus]
MSPRLTDAGILIPNPKFSENSVIEFANYAEYPGQVLVCVTSLQFGPHQQTLALGDKHGRVLLIFFFQKVVYVRYDVFRDTQLYKIKTNLKQTRNTKRNDIQRISRTSPVNHLCFIQKNNGFFLLVALHTFIIIYQIYSELQDKTRIVNITQNHKCVIHALFSLNNWEPWETCSQQSIYYVSGSRDVVVVWNAEDWSPVFKLPASEKLYPSLVAPVCIQKVTIPWPFSSNDTYPKNNCFDVRKNCPLLIGAILQNNKVVIWNKEDNFSTLATLKESDWKDSLLELLNDTLNASHVTVQLTILESTHHSSTVFEQTQCPVLICGRLLQRQYHKTQSFFGFLIRWFCLNSSSPDTLLKLVLLPRTPLQLKCFQTSLFNQKHISSQFKPAATLGYVCILNDIGQVEIRSLVELDLVLKILNISVTFPPPLEKNSCFITPLLSYFNITTVVLSFSNGVVQIIDFQLFLKLYSSDSPFKEKKHIPFNNRNSMSLLPVDEGSVYNNCPRGTLKKISSPCQEMDGKNTVSESDTLSKSALTLSDQSFSSISNISSLTSLQEEKNACQHSEVSFLPINDKEVSIPADIVTLKKLQRNASTNELVTNCNVLVKENKQQKKKKLECFIEKKLETIVSYEITSQKQTLPIPESILFITKLIDSNTEHDKKNLNDQHKQTCRVCLRKRYLFQYPYRYPDCERETLWRKCLELPMNQNLFNCLLDIMKQDGGVHPFYQNLETMIPLKDPLVLRRLKKMLGCLAYWSPFIKQVDWMAQLVFAVVSLFPTKPLISFEILVTMLIWWSYMGCLNFNGMGIIAQTKNQNTQPSHIAQKDVSTSCSPTTPLGLEKDFPCDLPETPMNESLCYWAWFAHPLPNTPPLGLMVLASHSFFSEDKQLWCYLVLRFHFLTEDSLHYLNTYDSQISTIDCESVTTGNSFDLISVHVHFGCRILWPLIRSWLSEVLPKCSLQTLWDHLFSNPEKPFLLVSAAIAILQVSRATLLMLDNLTDYFIWMKTSRSLPMFSVLQNMYAIEQRIKLVHMLSITGNEARELLERHLHLTLQDLHWPPLQNCDMNKKTRNAATVIQDNPSLKKVATDVMYPQLFLLPRLPQAFGDVQDVVKLLPCVNTTLHRSRERLFNTLRDQLALNEVSKRETSDATLQELLKQLVLIEEHKVDDTQWYERATREHEWARKTLSTLEKHFFLQDQPVNLAKEFSNKVFDMYEKTIKRLNTKKNIHHETPPLNESQESSTLTMTNTTMLKTLINDVELLLSHESSKHLSALNEERVAQRQRVLEEEEDRQSSVPFEAQSACDKKTHTSPHSNELCPTQETTTIQALVISSQTSSTHPELVESDTFRHSRASLDETLTSEKTRWLIMQLREGRKIFTRRTKIKKKTG